MKKIIINFLFTILGLNSKVNKKIYVSYFLRFLKKNHVFITYIKCFNIIRKIMPHMHDYDILKFLLHNKLNPSFYIELFKYNKDLIIAYRLISLEKKWNNALTNLKFELIKNYIKYGKKSFIKTF